MNVPPDVIYVVRPGESNPSLKYSLRSLMNLPHNRVFIAGNCPTWIRGVTAIPVRKVPSKLNAIENNLRAALRHPEISERVVYMNDDFFIMEPIDEVPITHGGPIEEYKGQQEFKWRMARTIENIKQYGLSVGAVTYDGVHMPLPLVTETARKVLSDMESGMLWRTWYGNVAAIGGVQVPNTKSKKGEVVPGPFFSTDRTTLSRTKQHLEDVLPKGSPYV